MAHQSGYTGSVAFGTASATNYAPNVSTGMKVTSWSVDQRTKSFQAYAKSEDFVTTFGTASEWIATVEFLVQDGALATDLEIHDASNVAKTVTTAEFKLNINANDFLTGSGVVTRLQFNDPLDGPVTATCEISGNGALAATVA